MLRLLSLSFINIFIIFGAQSINAHGTKSAYLDHMALSCPETLHIRNTSSTRLIYLYSRIFPFREDKLITDIVALRFKKYGLIRSFISSGVISVKTTLHSKGYFTLQKSQVFNFDAFLDKSRSAPDKLQCTYLDKRTGENGLVEFGFSEDYPFQWINTHIFSLTNFQENTICMNGELVSDKPCLLLPNFHTIHNNLDALSKPLYKYKGRLSLASKKSPNEIRFKVHPQEQRATKLLGIPIIRLHRKLKPPEIITESCFSDTYSLRSERPVHIEVTGTSSDLTTIKCRVNGKQTRVSLLKKEKPEKKQPTEKTESKDIARRRRTPPEEESESKTSYYTAILSYYFKYALNQPKNEIEHAYSILGISSTANLEEINRAYRKKTSSINLLTEKGRNKEKLIDQAYRTVIENLGKIEL